MTTTQLRVYRVEEGRLGDFVEAWRTSVVPLRRAHGFSVDAAWTIPDESRFAWLVSHDGPGSWQEAESAYYGSPERAAFDPDPARWVVEPLAWFLRPLEL